MHRGSHMQIIASAGPWAECRRPASTVAALRDVNTARSAAGCQAGTPMVQRSVVDARRRAGAHEGPSGPGGAEIEPEDGAGWPLRGPSDTTWGQAARDGTVMRTVSSLSSDGV
jgi:hypothetical protein